MASKKADQVGSDLSGYPSKTLLDRVREFYQVFPEATNEQLYAMFPDAKPETLRFSKSKVIKQMELQKWRLEHNEDTRGLWGVKDALPGDIKIPQKENSRKPLQAWDQDDRPAMTGREWKGEHYRYNQAGELEWYLPKNPNTSYAHWYEVFWLNEFNYPTYSPIGECHREWGAILDTGTRKLIFLCPRDHFKSSFINNGYIGYNICEHARSSDHWTGILNIAWDKSLALANMISVSNNLENNPLILDFYGYLIDEDRPNRNDLKYFTFQPKGSRPGFKTVGFRHGSITGLHPHLVMLDDVQDEPLSEALMEKFQRIIDKKLLPAVGKKGRLIVTGTHKGHDETNDGYLWLQNKPTFDLYKYPATQGAIIPPLGDISYEIKRVKVIEDGRVKKDYKGRTKWKKKFEVTVKNRRKYKVLYPERYQIEDLMEKYLELAKGGKADTFYCEYLLIPSNEKGRFFKKDRVKPMENMPFKEFHDLKSFWEFARRRHIPTYLWIDPGGKSKHGITMVVIAKWNGNWFILDMVVARAGILNATVALADLMEKWKVNIWGVEGNFLQAEAFGHVMSRQLRTILNNRNKGYLYRPPRIRNNVGDKIQRIREGMSLMLGIEGMPESFYVNTRAHDYGQFDREISEFGLDLKPSAKHEYDILDSIVSADNHLVGMASEPIWATA